VGKPKLCNPCCDGGAGSSSSSSQYAGSLNPITCNTCYYNISPAQWTVSISGITAGDCNSTYCTYANRKWTLSAVGPCTWRETGPINGMCFGFTDRMIVTLGISFSGGVTQLRLGFARSSAEFAFYRISYTNGIDCLVEHALPLISADSECGSWPSSLIVGPA
jgi:hypothetical protein